MDWLFATEAGGWPVHAIYVLEVLFVILTIFAFRVSRSRTGRDREMAAELCVLVGALALSVPIILAPMFFFVAGEWMMATLPGAIVIFPLALYIVRRAVLGKPR